MKRILAHLSEDACAPIWTLKSLRNDMLRHDLEHGSKQDQQRKLKRLQGALASLGLKRPPVGAAEFIALYEALLIQLVAMMQKLLYRLTVA